MTLTLVCSGCRTELYSGELKKISDIMKRLDNGRLVYSEIGSGRQTVYKCSKCDRVLEGPGRGERRLLDDSERAEDVLRQYAQPDAENIVK